jgi:hypothetical protein
LILKTKSSTYFILEVPEASIPAVEICCDKSLAGIIISARLKNTRENGVNKKNMYIFKY